MLYFFMVAQDRGTGNENEARAETSGAPTPDSK